jgi:hypothetical protein
MSAGGETTVPKGKKKYRTAIYHPPKSGMPYLVVTVGPEGVTATAVDTKTKLEFWLARKP